MEGYKKENEAWNEPQGSHAGQGGAYDQHCSL